MSLRDKLNRSNVDKGDNTDLTLERIKRFGVIENPFPQASQTVGNPRMDDTNEDSQIVAAIESFEASYRSQVIVIEGTQGSGKTNLLNHYQRELKELYQEDETFYIIRYYPDPEPTFDSIVRRIFQELGEDHLNAIARDLAKLDRSSAESVIDEAVNHEVRIVLWKLKGSFKKKGEETENPDVIPAALEWLLGLRVLKKHREHLGVNFRLDTVESKTQALRDLVAVSERLELLKGIFLMLDELEKQDDTLGKTVVVRYLSAIRALIDALPKRLFLMLGITPVAKQRYFSLLPAIASRLQTVVSLPFVRSSEEAQLIAEFYIKNARERATQDPKYKSEELGNDDLITAENIRKIFDTAAEEARRKGSEGVTHRALLHRLHNEAEKTLNNISNDRT